MLNRGVIFLVALLFIDVINAQDNLSLSQTVDYTTAVENRTEIEENIKFFFEIDRFEFDSVFSVNASQLRHLDEVMADGSVLQGLDSLNIIAAASLDGNLQKNTTLAANRAKTIKELLISRYPKIDPNIVQAKSIEEEWDGFRALVEADDNVPYKEEVLKVINGDREPDAKEWLLRTMKNCQVWDYLKLHILPKGRYGASVVFFYNAKSKDMASLRPKPAKIHYVQDTIVFRDTLMVVDTIDVDMRTLKFKRKYDVEVFTK